MNYADAPAVLRGELGPESLVIAEGRLGPERSYIDGIVPKAWAGGIYLGGYFRAPFKVENVIYGPQIPHDLIVMVTMADAHVSTFDAYLFFRRDRYGIVRATDWQPRAKGLCFGATTARDLGMDDATFANIRQHYPCRD